MSRPTLEEFYAGKRSKELPLVVDDVVRIKEGERVGQVAAVIVIEESDPELRFLVEYSDGSSETLPFRILELVPREE